MKYKGKKFSYPDKYRTKKTYNGKVYEYLGNQITFGDYGTLEEIEPWLSEEDFLAQFKVVLEKAIKGVVQKYKDKYSYLLFNMTTQYDYESYKEVIEVIGVRPQTEAEKEKLKKAKEATRKSAMTREQQQQEKDKQELERLAKKLGKKIV